MLRLVFYHNKTGEFCVSLLRRGFACTPEELPREIKTRCKASLVLVSQLIDPYSGAGDIMLADAKSRGWKVEATA